jgi:hypothetical protein
MSTLSLPFQQSTFGRDGGALSRFVAEAMRRQPALAGAGIVILVAMAPTVFAYLMEARTLYGINVWTKPLKFDASVALYFLTLAWFWGYLSPGLRRARAVTALAIVVAACGLLENIYISLQASRGVASHFNENTQLEVLLFQLMGLGAVIMTLGSLVLAILIARSGRGAIPPTFRASVIAGLVLTFVLGAGAGIVIAVNGGHWVGGVASDSGGLPIFGWARDSGDLRVAHFLGIHAMQVLPAFALVVERFIPRRTGLALGAFALAYVALTVAVGLQALAGRPFLPTLG